MKNRILVVLLALIAALAGCGGMEVRPPVVMKPSPQQPVVQQATPAQAQEVKLTPAPVSATPTPASASQPAKDSSTLKSLQPRKRFSEGTGHGMARVYKPRNKAEFVALLRNPEQLRVSCERLVQQMAEIHGLPFENCEGAAAEIARNSDYDVVPCRSGMFDRDNQLTVTNSDGSAFGIWSRSCLSGETVLVYKDRTVASTMCANVAVPTKQAPPKGAPPTAVQPPTLASPGPIHSCPDWWVLEIANWENKAFYLPGVEQTHAKEKFHVVFLNAQHVSRTHGEQFRKAYDRGDIIHSAVPRNFRVSLIMTRESYNGDTTITDEKFYRDIVVTGSREVGFPIADINYWDAIRVVAKDGEEVLSPPTFAATGLHEMRFFNKMPGTLHGEWDNPKQKPCYKTEHWIEQLPQPPPVVQQPESVPKQNK